MTLFKSGFPRRWCHQAGGGIHVTSRKPRRPCCRRRVGSHHHSAPLYKLSGDGGSDDVSPNTPEHLLQNR
ncbi:unnamed protein product, partial [Ectocarpus sp. 6 AP-2014]